MAKKTSAEKATISAGSKSLVVENPAVTAMEAFKAPIKYYFLVNSPRHHGKEDRYKMEERWAFKATIKARNAAEKAAKTSWHSYPATGACNAMTVFVSTGATMINCELSIITHTVSWRPVPIYDSKGNIMGRCPHHHHQSLIYQRESQLGQASTRP